ncbi:MAG TPA: DUF4333 domain-containing protein [Ilumatobacteraceae bacterium]|nr:DUF4333 domain-containing protein [Ilumatobacteraceae bacterium]
MVAVIAALALAGCGSGSSTDTAKTPTTSAASQVGSVDMSAVESGIKKQLSVSGASVTSVKCPSDVKSTPGATFDCTVTWSNGATGKVKVTETTLNHYTYEPVSGSVQIPGATVDKTLEQYLAKAGLANATVSCPQNIIVKTGTTVTCNVTGAGGATSEVTFAFSSAEGTVDPSSVKTS